MNGLFYRPFSFLTYFENFMANSVQVTIQAVDEKIREAIIAHLSVLDVDGFEENDNELLAYYTEGKIDEEELKEIIKRYDVTSSNSIIPSQNWNKVWESNFPAVLIDNFCAIRAHFHEPVKNAIHEIIITPKMSFGTGHHATTHMMIQQMSELDFIDKNVADFGTGTGVLAILAEKLGSQHIFAIDNDDWSIENAKENFERNNCTNIEIKKANSFLTTFKYDIILANINRNVIIDNLNSLVFALANRGFLLLSGLLVEDEHDIIIAALHHNLSHVKTVVRDKWISLLMVNNFQMES
jgi:ribosomal protein L11 methyltransferase